MALKMVQIIEQVITRKTALEIYLSDVENETSAKLHQVEDFETVLRTTGDRLRIQLDSWIQDLKDETTAIHNDLSTSLRTATAAADSETNANIFSDDSGINSDTERSEPGEESIGKSSNENSVEISNDDSDYNLSTNEQIPVAPPSDQCTRKNPTEHFSDDKAPPSVQRTDNNEQISSDFNVRPSDQTTNERIPSIYIAPPCVQCVRVTSIGRNMNCASRCLDDRLIVDGSSVDSWLESVEFGFKNRASNSATNDREYKDDDDTNDDSRKNVIKRGFVHTEHGTYVNIKSGRTGALYMINTALYATNGRTLVGLNISADIEEPNFVCLSVDGFITDLTGRAGTNDIIVSTDTQTIYLISPLIREMGRMEIKSELDLSRTVEGNECCSFTLLSQESHRILVMLSKTKSSTQFSTLVKIWQVEIDDDERLCNPKPVYRFPRWSVVTRGCDQVSDQLLYTRSGHDREDSLKRVDKFVFV
ncbi:uncharacterized protein LOC141902422 [Tubulanus polymorphus]|uniref:uncharacterized protein LOC141902422 n=1 Tax=Tubulanus polymorphus TaxID=672921 RepID=UPI003DA6B3EB